MKRLPKGSSEPLILKALLAGNKSVTDIERKTRLKKPTLYLSLNRLKRKGLVKPLGTRRRRLWALTGKGRRTISNRIEAEKIVQKIIGPLKRAIRLGLTYRQIQSMLSK